MQLDERCIDGAVRRATTEGGVRRVESAEHHAQLDELDEGELGCHLKERECRRAEEDAWLKLDERPGWDGARPDVRTEIGSRPSLIPIRDEDVERARQLVEHLLLLGLQLLLVGQVLPLASSTTGCSIKSQLFSMAS